MLPVLILIVPPSIIGGGYGFWCFGHSTALSLFQQTAKSVPGAAKPSPSPPHSQCAGSYAAGLSTCVGTYALLGSQFHRVEGAAGAQYVPSHKRTTPAQFHPPKTVAEAFQRVGKPLLLRAGAGGAALFCAGLAQTFVALSISNSDSKSR